MTVIEWPAFGERVLVSRRRRNLSQAQLAREVGISRNYVSMIERGIADPSYAIVLKICIYLGVDLPQMVS
jgi:transcriptional regulator with XRE-family HTH domain